MKKGSRLVLDNDLIVSGENFKADMKKYGYELDINVFPDISKKLEKMQHISQKAE